MLDLDSQGRTVTIIFAPCQTVDKNLVCLILRCPHLLLAKLVEANQIELPLKINFVPSNVVS